MNPFYKYILGLCLALLPFSSPGQQYESPVFRDGDNVTFVGNSITHAGYHNKYIMLYYITRYPGMKLNFYNAAITGDTSEDLNNRMERDILIYDADVFTLMIGMNDAFRYEPAREDDLLLEEKNTKAVEKYGVELDKIVAAFKESAREVILFTPSIFDNTVESERYGNPVINDRLFLFGEYIKRLSDNPQIRIVDMWRELMRVNGEMQADDPASTVIGADRVHPDNYGGFVMAYAFLKDLGESPDVSYAAIDFQERGVVESRNTDIGGLVFPEDGLSFDMTEFSLPFPMNIEIDKANTYVDFQQEFNNELLKINNMPAGSYSLSIDGYIVGKYDGRELSAGINLALNPATPQYCQAIDVMDICEEFRKLADSYRNMKFIETQRMKDFSDRSDPQACVDYVQKLLANGENLGEWDRRIYGFYMENKLRESDILKELDRLTEKAYDLARPQSRRYEIKKIE